MAGLKSLAKDTAIYGLSSIVGRFLNWCLVPLYTTVFAAAEYGVVTYVYSIVALVMIILTYGLETGFFRFANHDEYKDPEEVYTTALTSLITTSLLFIAIVFAFLRPISHAMQCGDHTDYIWMMAITVAIDAFTALPFAYLRFRKRPLRFAALRLINIGLNIGLNLLFIVVCPWLMKVAPQLVGWYSPDFGIGYIFLANLISSVVLLLLLTPELTGRRWRFNRPLLTRMLSYSFPLLILGIAGIMNQTIDKILYPLLVPANEAMHGLGIYGANYKIAIVMVMFLQAFRFAYEPFVFAKDREKGADNRQSYADAMKYFVVFAMIIFLGVMYYLDLLRHFISSNYFEGLKVVPIIMLAELFFGVFFNLSLWYKLTDKTYWGAIFSTIGLIVTVIGNIVLVPRMGYMGCAWAALACYTVMMLLSYFIGRNSYPVPYQTGRILGYFGIAIAFFAGGMAINTDMSWLNMLLRTPLLLLYIYMVLRTEHIPLSSLLSPLHRHSGK
jgi:O-antigen/teichoic acid export membrane protein